MTKPLIIAHRGASGYAPENTLISFKKALSMEADGLELDLHLSKDGELVVCHDEKVDRTTDGSGFINDLTLKELKKLDAGLWFGSEFEGARLPILTEVLDLIKDKNVILNIELKSGPSIYPGIEEKVVGALNDFHMINRTIISSFNHYSLMKIKQIHPELKTGVLYMAGLIEPWEYAKKLKAEAIHPLFYNIIPEIVQGCLANQIMINPFTVNDENTISKISRTGVTGIITDYPDRAKRVIKSLYSLTF